MAIRKTDIPLEPLTSRPESTLSIRDTKNQRRSSNMTVHSQFLNQLEDGMHQNYAIDQQYGLVMKGKAPQKSNESEAMKKEELATKEQLARSAAAICIQSLFKGWLTRRKYIAVVHSKLTVESLASDTEKNQDGMPQIQDLSLQVQFFFCFSKIKKIDYRSNSCASIVCFVKYSIFREIFFLIFLTFVLVSIYYVQHNLAPNIFYCLS
jgi:intracellular sulfur oxidation DsrE/DsrF family protein